MAPLTEEQIAAKEAELAEREAALEAAKGSGEGDLDNSAWKSHPLTSKLTSEIAELRKAEDDRKAAEEQAKKDAEIEAAKAKEDWKEAERLKNEQHQAEIDALKRDNLFSKLRSDLAVEGFNKRGVDLLAHEYNPEGEQSIEDYIKAAKEDEGNKQFLAAQSGRVQKTPPGDPPAGGKVDWDEIRAMEQTEGWDSESVAKRAKAREAIAAYRKANDGAYPYKL